MIVLSCDRAGGVRSRVTAAGEAPSYQPGEVLVRFKAGVVPERAAEIARESGVEPITYNRRFLLLRAKITGGGSVEETVTRFSGLPEVEYAEPNYLRKGLDQHP